MSIFVLVNARWLGQPLALCVTLARSLKVGLRSALRLDRFHFIGSGAHLGRMKSGGWTVGKFAPFSALALMDLCALLRSRWLGCKLALRNWASPRMPEIGQAIDHSFSVQNLSSRQIVLLYIFAELESLGGSVASWPRGLRAL